MENYRPPVGTPVDELDTPCLLIDMDAMEHNMGLIAETYKDTICKMRAHIKNLKAPVLAHMQIDTGGTVGGVCAAKVAEAEVMVDAMRANEVPHTYLLMEGEDHFLAKSDTVVTTREAELSFYGQLFGFEPAGEISPVRIEGLPRE